jgi:hypothetical protein
MRAPHRPRFQHVIRNHFQYQRRKPQRNLNPKQFVCLEKSAADIDDADFVDADFLLEMRQWIAGTN